MKRVEVWDSTSNVRAFPHVIESSILETEDELIFRQDTERHDRTCVNKHNALFIGILDEIEED